MKPVARFLPSFDWEGISVLAYKTEGDTFRDITRRVLFGSDLGLRSELRYFEIGPGGHSTLEHHAHPHAVLILRGRGEVLVGREIFEVSQNDLVRVAPHTLHQFRALEQPLGFLCLVDCERDRPARPSADELAALRADPTLAAFIRT